MQKKIFVTVTNEEGLVLDNFRIIDLSFMHDDSEPENNEASYEFIGRPMCNAETIERLQHVCYREVKG